MLSRKTLEMCKELVLARYADWCMVYQVVLDEQIPKEEMFLKALDEIEKELMTRPYNEEQKQNFMTKNEAIDLAIDAMWTTLGTWTKSTEYQSVYKNTIEAIEILKGLRDHRSFYIEKRHKQEEKE